MVRGALSGVRYTVLSLLLCLVVAAQASALASETAQHQAHCCMLCHVGPLPFLHTPATFTVTPVLSAVCWEPAPETQSVPEVPLAPGCSRAPPASAPDS
jgi:hypothetical protein